VAKELQKKNIRNVPPEVKGAVVEYSEVHGMTISDVVVMILTGYFGGELGGYTPSRGPSLGDQIHFFMSPGLAGKIWRESRKTGETESSCVISILARFFGIPYEPVLRGRKRAAA
jgi:hypothetical protein